MHLTCTLIPLLSSYILKSSISINLEPMERKQKGLAKVHNNIQTLRDCRILS